MHQISYSMSLDNERRLDRYLLYFIEYWNILVVSSKMWTRVFSVMIEAEIHIDGFRILHGLHMISEMRLFILSTTCAWDTIIRCLTSFLPSLIVLGQRWTGSHEYTLLFWNWPHLISNQPYLKEYFATHTLLESYDTEAVLKGPLKISLPGLYYRTITLWLEKASLRPRYSYTIMD